MFIDKLVKAQQETAKTKDRLSKLKQKQAQMNKSFPEEHEKQDAFIVLKQMALKELSQK